MDTKNTTHKINSMSGHPFGVHRVLKPVGVLPQPAQVLDNDMNKFYDNEILVEVDTLNIDSASFTQIEEEAHHDKTKIKNQILAIVNSRGKMQNPVTGSGGMFIGKVLRVGEKLQPQVQLKTGDLIASLVSLSLTPLFIEEILEINSETDQVKIKGKAILFEKGLFVKLPDDLPQSLALAVLDVAGAPAQTSQLVQPNKTVVILGAGGKSGLLCSYMARKKLGPTPSGKLIGIEYSEKAAAQLREFGFCDEVVCLDASRALDCYETIKNLTHGQLADLVINCVNIKNTEMTSILMCKDGGTVYFFSMATSFTQAALGAEGVGRDIQMLIGNGYTRGHAELSLQILRDSLPLRNLFEKIYV